MKGLEDDGVIQVERTSTDSITMVELSETERLRGREDFDFYCFLLWPFVEATWLGVVSLMGLTPPRDLEGDIWLDLKEAQEKAQLVRFNKWTQVCEILIVVKLGKTLYHQGDLSYFEAVNKESLKNAYQRFHEEGIILLSKSRDSKIPTTVKLSREWVPSRDESGAISQCGKLWEFTEMIAQTRREGQVPLCDSGTEV